MKATVRGIRLTACVAAAAWLALGVGCETPGGADSPATPAGAPPATPAGAGFDGRKAAAARAEPGATLSGATAERAAAADGRVAVVNAWCPVMPGVRAGSGGRGVLPELTRAWRGQTIGFCCGECPAQWDAMSDAEREAAMKDAMAGAERAGTERPW